MSDSAQDLLLEKLANLAGATQAPDPWANLAATQPQHTPARVRGGNLEPKKDDRVDELLQKITSMAKEGTGKPPELPALPTAPTEEFIPIEPDSIRDAGLTDTQVEALVLKYLLARGCCTGREGADQ